MSLAANRLRTFLGGLAIAVAVGTIAVVVEGLDGFARYSRLTSARAFGSDTFVVAQVVAGNLNRREFADKQARNPAIRRNDVRFLDRNAAGEVIYAPLTQRPADVTAGGRKYENAAIGGTAAALFQIRDLGIARGRFISRSEEERAAQVAVIGADVADALFPGVDPLGRPIRVGGRGFVVVGVQARQGTAGGTSLDRNVWMPLQAFERVFGVPDSLQVFARAPNPEQTDQAEGRAIATMRARRQLRPGVADNFDVLTPESARGFVQRIAESVGAAAAPISVMALLAAIVVVTNTTLVSVTQRTREIGVRRALGASRSHVMFEVLAEATLIAAVGGTIGLIAASVLLAVASGPLGLPLPLRFSTVLWSLGAAGLSGLVADWYP
ncbi:MAG: ABC transporter permease, partial [Planctomycetes bacterium]|nr:ABC transporter permease [Planctomycetota bacterium]